jgi:mono/diheme cytochrome c family protein
MVSGWRWISIATILLLIVEAAMIATHVRNASNRDSYFVAKEGLHPQSLAAAPIDAGPDLPLVGRSLFDQLSAKRDGSDWVLPFPFSNLLAAFARAGGCENGNSCTQRVLIPLGRSLQRTAAAPDFFKQPRMVVAFSGEANESTRSDFPLLKDRLYLGYQEKAKLIEVISFNETAGRFEFQLVKDYGPGMTPKVSYANRVVCVSCHQNFAPLFSRQVWDETNANPQISQRLAKTRTDFDGFPVQIGVDVPNAFDDATDRANLLPAYELLWDKGCGADHRCRARALEAALQYRLTNQRIFDFQSVRFQQEFLAPFEKNWHALWPNGLKIPSNDIPNRDPLQFADSEQLANVPARFEALLARGHKEIWQWETDRFRLIKGIGEFFSNRDIRLLAEGLKFKGEAVQTSAGFAALSRAIDALVDGPQGQAALDAPTIQRLRLRDALFRALNIDAGKTCCDDRKLPKPIAEETPRMQVATQDSGLNYFYVHCARCHGGDQPFPPNFMNGDNNAVQRKVRQCADRILYRLSMWQIDSAQRTKTPMPPETMLPTDAIHWVQGNALAAMRAYVVPFTDPLLRRAPDEWLGRSYESLPTCTLH